MKLTKAQEQAAREFTGYDLDFLSTLVSDFRDERIVGLQAFTGASDLEIAVWMIHHRFVRTHVHADGALGLSITAAGRAALSLAGREHGRTEDSVYARQEARVRG